MESHIKLLPKQAVAWDYIFDSKVQEIGYGGAAGGGKSMLGAYMAIVLSEMYPGARGVIGRKELKNLKQTTMVTLFKCLNNLGYFTGKDFIYNEQNSTMKFINGSEIIFKDMSHSPQDPEYTRFGGLEITWAWVDESNEVPEKSKNILKTRVGRLNKFDDKIVKPVFLETFNPNKGHVYNDYYKPYKMGTLPDYRVFVPALAGDNPHLPQAYLDNLNRADKITRERLLNGNFDYDDDPTTMCNQDATHDLFTNTITAIMDKYITADIARYGADKTVIGVWQGLELIKIETLHISGIDETSAFIKKIARDYQVPFSQIIADEDGVGGGIVDILRGIKGFMGGSSPLEIWNHTMGRMDKANFRNLRHQCYFKLADMVNSHQIKISDHDFKSEIIEELGTLKRKTEVMEGKFEIISKDEIKQSLGRSPDYADMLMMRMYFLLKKTNSVTSRTFAVERIAKPYKNHNI